MIDPSVQERMQREWNERAREDAHFYVAFGRKDQDPEEFFLTGSDMVRSLTAELKRLPQHADPKTWRALEIGCGPGRLLKPMSRFFGEIHGVDVSDEMIRRAQANLADVPHAHAHHGSGSDLAQFANESFDFIYSYAVFQHIPSRAVVMRYLDEAHRVLSQGGILRVQINGLDEAAQRYDTWSGVRISGDEIRHFARSTGLQLLALEGERTQYMWATLRKAQPSPISHSTARIRRVTNAHSSEPAAPSRGRFSSITLWVEGLALDSDLHSLAPTIDGLETTATYIGPREADGLQQVNLLLPGLARTGLVEVRIADCEPTLLRVIPPGPLVPRLLSVADGVNLLAGTRISSRTVKVTVEEIDAPESLCAVLDGVPVSGLDNFCADPRLPRYEINFQLPAEVATGEHSLVLHLGRRLLGKVMLDVVSP